MRDSGHGPPGSPLPVPTHQTPAAAEFSLAEPHKALGSRLAVNLPAGLKAGDKLTVRRGPPNPGPS